MTSVERLNPVQILQQMRELENRMAKGLVVVDEAYGAYLDADADYDFAEAEVYVSLNECPAHERKYRMVLAVRDQRKTRDIALRAYKRAERQMRYLEGRQSRLQSANKNVMQAWQVAGVTEP